MGIVLNRPAADLSMPDLLVQLEIIPEAERIRLPHRVGRMQVLMGGPVETSRGFVLHSPDFFIDQSTLPIDDGVCLTATIDILRAIASGEGPQSAVLALGYAGWSAGQLESEIQANGWLNCPADAELIFHSAVDAQIRDGAAPDRHRSGDAVDGSRPRLIRRPLAASGAAPDELAGLQHRHRLAEDRALRIFAAELIELDRVGLASPRPRRRPPCRARAPS